MKTRAVRRPAGKFTSIDALKGKKVGAERHHSPEIHHRQTPGNHDRSFDSYQNAKLDPQNGRIDAVFGDTAVVTEWLKSNRNWPRLATR